MKDYVQQVLRTEPPVTQELANRMLQNVRAIHALMGLATEVGELIDAYKKHVFYGKPLDAVNAKEELGDVMWYLGLEMDVLGTDFAKVQERNIAKLRARYPDRFAEDKAQNRDLETERSVLEEGKATIGSLVDGVIMLIDRRAFLQELSDHVCLHCGGDQPDRIGGCTCLRDD